MTENLVKLDLSRFTPSDIGKVRRVGAKLKLMRRWFRFDRGECAEGEEIRLYSGDRGPARYSAYRIVRRRDGRYVLLPERSDDAIWETRSIDAVIDALPQDFYYADYAIGAPKGN